KDAQQRANADRENGVTPKQREKFNEIDQLATLAKTKADWEYIRSLEADAGRPVSERFSHNDKEAALQLKKRQGAVSADEHAQQRAEITPEVKAKQEAHDKAVDQLTAEVNSNVAKKDEQVTKSVVDQANAVESDNGRKEISVEAAISL